MEVEGILIRICVLLYVRFVKVDNSNYVVHMYQGITDYTGTVDNSNYVVHMYKKLYL